MHLLPLVAVVEPVNGAVGEREMRHVVEEDGGDAMAVEVEGGDCGQASGLLRMGPLLLAHFRRVFNRDEGAAFPVQASPGDAFLPLR